jgi:signal transduction histidine kinase
MCLFFFIQYLIIMRKEHLFYSVYLLALSVYYVLAMPDFFFHVADSDAAAIHSFNLFKRPIQFMSSVFYTLFVIYYLGLSARSIFLYRFFRLLIGLYIVCAAACLLMNFMHINYDKAYYLFSLLLFPLQLYVVAALFRHKVPYSKYIIWGSIITILGSVGALILSIYNNNLVVQNNTHPLNVFLPVQISIMIDLLLFSIALQKKIADNEKSLMSSVFQRQQAVMLERERIIADLHDDVGGGISSIRMMSDLMMQDAAAEPGDKYGSFPQKISQTVKEIAQRMHTIIWSLNEENDTLGNFTEYVKQYGTGYFENTGVEFILNTDKDLPSTIQLSGVQRKNLFLVIKEALHNILKHAEATRVAVTIFIQSNRLGIVIEDNGKGMKDAHLINGNGFGNGVKNMKRRMAEINGETGIASSGNGTRISAGVPL